MFGESALYFEQPPFATPQIQLTESIERLLRQTHTPISIAVAVINLITEDDLCTLSSSSPHHLFMGTYRAVLRPASDMRDVDAEWVKFAGDLVPLAEVTRMRGEVDMMLPTLSERRWTVLGHLVSEDVHKTVNVLYTAELLQAKEQEREAEEFLLVEEESVRSGFLVYERDPGSESRSMSPMILTIGLMGKTMSAAKNRTYFRQTPSTNSLANRRPCILLNS